MTQAKSILSSLLCIWLLLNAAYAQEHSKYPQNYFRSPIENRIFLSGTFGELRGGHFHAGLDIKTGGVEGAKVLASADGWISRIKISPYGYGNCIYISHPNGYTTVYAHLQKILGEAGDYVKAQQYKREQFAIDLQIKAHQLPVKKGQQIALSGNSGSSGGPHVHFEIRDSRTQEPINPLLFGIQVKDYFTPQIRSIRVYPVGTDAKVNHKTTPQNYSTKGWGKTYRLKTMDTLNILGDFYLAINTIDKQNDTQNKNGVYSIELKVDNRTIYRHALERTNFSTTRYLNTLIDYPFYKTYKAKYQRTYQSPNNRLKIADIVYNNGVISLQDNEVHLIEYIVKDAPGNTSVLSFYVLSLPNSTADSSMNSTAWRTDVNNSYEDDDLQFTAPVNAFYDTISFAAKISQTKHPKALTNTYIIGNSKRAMQKNAKVRLKNINLSEADKLRAYVGKINKNYIGAYHLEWEGKDVIFSTRDMGDYAIFVDNTPPTIQYVTQKNKAHTLSHIRFKVTEKESGIKAYNAYLNNEWVLLEWDPKTHSMFYCVDRAIPTNSEFKIVVSDQVGNKASKRIQL